MGVPHTADLSGLTESEMRDLAANSMGVHTLTDLNIAILLATDFEAACPALGPLPWPPVEGFRMPTDAEILQKVFRIQPHPQTPFYSVHAPVLPSMDTATRRPSASANCDKKPRLYNHLLNALALDDACLGRCSRVVGFICRPGLFRGRVRLPLFSVSSNRWFVVAPVRACLAKAVGA